MAEINNERCVENKYDIFTIIIIIIIIIIIYNEFLLYLSFVYFLK
jgi:hypothetical protein